jgi:hypothetical protein
LNHLPKPRQSEKSSSDKSEWIYCYGFPHNPENHVNRSSEALKYKQALRGLFIAGTSSLLLAETTEKVGDEPGLNSDTNRNVLYNLAGIKP